MKNEIIPFQFGNLEVRTTKDESGEAWWVAKDVCVILGIKNVTQAVNALPDDEKAMSDIGYRQPQANVISESGLYRMIFRSDKPEAEAFRRWVFHEVLPAIRKTGKYQLPSHMIAIEKKYLSPSQILDICMDWIWDRSEQFTIYDMDHAVTPVGFNTWWPHCLKAIKMMCSLGLLAEVPRGKGIMPRYMKAIKSESQEVLNGYRNH